MYQRDYSQQYFPVMRYRVKSLTEFQSKPANYKFTNKHPNIQIHAPIEV